MKRKEKLPLNWDAPLTEAVRALCRRTERLFDSSSGGLGQEDIQDLLLTLEKKRSFTGLSSEEQALQSKVWTEVRSYLMKKYAKTQVSFLGPLATFTHQAVIEYFGSSVALKPEKSISDVFQEVEKGNSDFGVAPVENSVEGAVSYTLDLFISSQVHICSEILLPIRQNLFSRSPALEKVCAVYSHANVFGQCRSWLRAHLPNAEQVETSSTSEAVRIIKTRKDSAAIGSRLCQDIYGVNILAESIQDDVSNTTRFLVISRRKVRSAKNDKTSIVYLVKDKPGALFSSLKPFKDLGVNLVKIESRPSKMKAWEYYFFVDMEGCLEDKKISAALEKLQKNTVFFKILGSYPAGGE